MTKFVFYTNNRVLGGGTVGGQRPVLKVLCLLVCPSQNVPESQ